MPPEPSDLRRDHISKMQPQHAEVYKLSPVPLEKYRQKQHAMDAESPSHMNPDHVLDRYGFILNMDTHGNLLEFDERRKERVPSVAETTRTENRKKKWQMMLAGWSPWPLKSQKGWKYKQILRRVRKGIPDSERGTVWPVLCNVPQKIKDNPGLYADLVRRSVVHPETPNEATGSMISSVSGSTTANGLHSKSFRCIQDTIERDIHRTFPRHCMFCDDDNKSSSDDSNGCLRDGDNEKVGEASSLVDNNTLAASKDEENDDQSETYHVQTTINGFCGGTSEIATAIHELTSNDETKVEIVASSTTSTTSVSTPQLNSPGAASLNSYHGRGGSDAVMPDLVLEGRGGQAAMRRVLKAYSTYDRDVGYCQGMNFIAGMFLTLMTEEEAFWMLVVVMFEQPCKMRGLFGEGMRETHKVLYVAEKLIHQFLPALSKHLDNESIHVTMYATQWLLTVFTSSFHFDLVTRVWDCFIVEGWKIIYRVMLSFLQHHQTKLLSLNFEEILGFVRDIQDCTDGAVVVDEAINIPLRWAHIHKYENEWQEQQRRK